MLTVLSELSVLQGSIRAFIIQQKTDVQKMQAAVAF